jgi:dolichol-phosphate mannosyltransferase
MEYLLSIVVPVYKEEGNISPFVEAVERIANQHAIRYELIFCLDPSPDKTKAAILKYVDKNPSIKLLTFSRRFGQPAATMAGILHAKGDICIVIDVDLQDPVEVMPELISKWAEGYDVVYAKRRSRQGETLAKRVVSHAAYKIINHISDVNIPTNTGDFRLISRRVIEELRRLKETHGFLRGAVAFVGFPTSFVEYDRKPRYSGKGKYNRFTGSFTIGFNGLFCFSSKPLFYILSLGFVFFVASFIMIFAGAGLTAVLLTLYSGIQICVMWLLGQYIARIYDEAKDRPMYIIDEIIEH